VVGSQGARGCAPELLETLVGVGAEVLGEVERAKETLAGSDEPVRRDHARITADILSTRAHLFLRNWEELPRLLAHSDRIGRDRPQRLGRLLSRDDADRVQDVRADGLRDASPPWELPQALEVEEQAERAKLEVGMRRAVDGLAHDCDTTTCR
jgi:hypothetical protein